MERLQNCFGLLGKTNYFIPLNGWESAADTTRRSTPLVACGNVESLRLPSSESKIRQTVALDTPQKRAKRVAELEAAYATMEASEVSPFFDDAFIATYSAGVETRLMRGVEVEEDYTPDCGDTLSFDAA